MKTSGNRDKERGIALIIVMGMMAIAGVMVTHVTVLSEVVASEAKVAAGRGRLAYVAESAADRAYWLLLSDQEKNRDRQIGVDRETLATEEEEAWMMDGSSHDMTVDGYKVRVVISDPDTGLDFAGQIGNLERQIRQKLITNDMQKDDPLDKFMDVLLDYVDGDDFQRKSGRERQDYAEDGFPELPRNAPLQFREEAYWLKGLDEVLAVESGDSQGPMAGLPDPATLRIIPPRGRSFPHQNVRDSIYSATPQLIQRLARLSNADLAIVLDALRKWSLNRRGTLDQYLDMPLVERLKQSFSFETKESRVAATIIVTAYLAGDESEELAGRIRRELRVTRELRRSTGNQPTEMLVYWDRFLP